MTTVNLKSLILPGSIDLSETEKGRIKKGFDFQFTADLVIPNYLDFELFDSNLFAFFNADLLIPHTLQITNPELDSQKLEIVIAKVDTDQLNIGDLISFYLSGKKESLDLFLLQITLAVA